MYPCTFGLQANVDIYSQMAKIYVGQERECVRLYRVVLIACVVDEKGRADCRRVGLASHSELGERKEGPSQLISWRCWPGEESA